MEAVVVMAVLAVVVLVIAAPLRRGAVQRDVDAQREARADLEGAKAAKYREIRDAELDHRTGKLSDADWRAVDRELRAEAMELLRRLDALGEVAEDDAAAPAGRAGSEDPIDRVAAVPPPDPATRAGGAPAATPDDLGGAPTPADRTAGATPADPAPAARRAER